MLASLKRMDFHRKEATSIQLSGSSLPCVLLLALTCHTPPNCEDNATSSPWPYLASSDRVWGRDKVGVQTR